MTQFRTLAFIATLLAATKPAQALDCFAPDPARFYLAASAAAATYLVVHGSFTPDGIAPLRRRDKGTDIHVWTGRLTGTSLDSTGSNHPFDREIVVLSACIGALCDTALPDSPILAFVAIDRHLLVLRTDACSNFVVPNPTPADIAVIEACNLGGACAPIQ